MELRLAGADPGNHLVDLRSGADAPTAVQEWLTDRQDTRSFGAMVPRSSYCFDLSPTVLAEEYDGLAYVAVSSDSRPLPVPGRAR